MSAKEVNVSRTMCFALRHKPEAFGLTLDAQGWVNIMDLARALKVKPLDILQIAASDAKGRYGLRSHNTEIRCVQGHSTDQVDLIFDQSTPPEVLYHGTNSQSLQGIFKDGITPQTRHFVHMSGDLDVAVDVASRRRGTWAIILIHALKMHDTGIHSFYKADNGVWLTKRIPPEFLEVIQYDTSSNQIAGNGTSSGTIEGNGRENQTTDDPSR